MKNITNLRKKFCEFPPVGTCRPKAPNSRIPWKEDVTIIPESHILRQS